MKTEEWVAMTTMWDTIQSGQAQLTGLSWRSHSKQSVREASATDRVGDAYCWKAFSGMMQ
jgi:hypothetical protein